MSDASKFKLQKLTGINDEVAEVLEASGLLTPKDIKLADDADLEAAGLSKDEVKGLRKKCPHFKKPKD